MEALSLSRFVLWEGATSLRTNLKRPPDASESTIDGVTNVYSVRVVAMPYGAARGEEKKKIAPYGGGMQPAWLRPRPAI